jgi:hypothetical protein
MSGANVIAPRRPGLAVEFDWRSLDRIKAWRCSAWRIRDIDTSALCWTARVFFTPGPQLVHRGFGTSPYVHAKLQAVHHEHGAIGRYIISDRPMTEAEWIRERATMIDVMPEKADE